MHEDLERVDNGLPAQHSPLGRHDYGPYIDQPTDWRRYVAALWRYKWLILAITVVGGGAGVAASRLVAPVYVAQLNVWVRASAGGEAGEGPIRSSELLSSYAWVDLLRTYLVLDTVVHDLQLYLHVDPPEDTGIFSGLTLAGAVAAGEYRLDVDAAGRTFTLEDANGDVLQHGEVGDSVGAGLGFRWTPATEVLPPSQSIRFTIDNPRDVASQLSENLGSRIDRAGNFVRLSLEGDDPQRLATVLNGVGERYTQVASELKDELLSQVADILNDQLAYAAVNLREAEAALESYRVETITLPSERATPITPGLQITQSPALSNYFALNTELDQVRQDREAIERTLAQDSAWQTLELVPATQNSPGLVRALEELVTKRAELGALRDNYTDRHPLVQQLLRDITELEQNTIPGLATRLLSQLEQREAELQSDIAAASGELREVPERAIQEASLERRVEIAAEFYTELQVRREEAWLAEANALPDLAIIDRAVPPQRPINEKDRPRIILIAFLASLGLSLGLAILLDRFDPHIKYPNQVTQGLGLPILGAIPHVGHEERGRLRKVAEVIEAFRMIRLGVLQAHGKAAPIVIAIASPGAEEGKSLVSANLALAFADLGHRTIAIDADVRRGHLHRSLGARRKPGLTDYLAGEAAQESAIQQTPFKGLYFIGCGRRRQNGPELLQSRAMHSLLADLKASFDVLIVDGPPLGVGADSLALAALAVNVVIVLRTGSTDRTGTEIKLEMLERLPVRILGAVLNDVRHGPAYYYYSPYYASYLPGYEAADEAADEAGAGATDQTPGSADESHGRNIRNFGTATPRERQDGAADPSSRSDGRKSTAFRQSSTG